MKARKKATLVKRSPGVFEQFVFVIRFMIGPTTNCRIHVSSEVICASRSVAFCTCWLTAAKVCRGGGGCM